jgi:LPXTG-site transpeptidase (sortase) family protein
MSAILEKTKKYSKKVALIGSLFLAVFAALFYLVNLDVTPIKNLVKNSTSVAPIVDMNAEIKNRLGSTTFSVESYTEWIKRNDVYDRNSGLDSDPDKDGLPNYLEYVYGTNPLKADTDGDGFSDKQEIVNGYDPDAPGDAKLNVEVTISKINANAPMVWSQNEDENTMLKDLESGVSHYPKSAAPGQNGNVIISGHSSNYVWAKGDYNYVFKNLNDLQNGDIITLKTSQKNGRIIAYQYKVNDKFVATPDDERIFASGTSPVLTLSTCWPIGTNFRRLIVKTELVK